MLIAELGDAERLALAYAPAALKSVYTALLALDAEARRIALSARDPLPAQLRLAWWRDACARLPDAREHPVLDALADSWSWGVEPLVGLVDAWEEVLVAEDGLASAAQTVATARAGAFAALTGTSAALVLDAARAWTLATLAGRARQAGERSRMRDTIGRAPAARLPRSLRPLALLAGLARRALATGSDDLLGDRWSPLVAVRLGILGR